MAGFGQSDGAPAGVFFESSLGARAFRSSVVYVSLNLQSGGFMVKHTLLVLSHKNFRILRTKELGEGDRVWLMSAGGDTESCWIIFRNRDGTHEVREYGSDLNFKMSYGNPIPNAGVGLAAIGGDFNTVWITMHLSREPGTAIHKFGIDRENGVLFRKEDDYFMHEDDIRLDQGCGGITGVLWVNGQDGAISKLLRLSPRPTYRVMWSFIHAGFRRDVGGNSHLVWAVAKPTDHPLHVYRHVGFDGRLLQDVHLGYEQFTSAGIGGA